MVKYLVHFEWHFIDYSFLHENPAISAQVTQKIRFLSSMNGLDTIAKHQLIIYNWFTYT